MPPLRLRWARDTLLLDVPDFDQPLAVLRHAVAERTHLPVDRFKLIHAGAIMKDDAAPLSAYRLRPNSVVALIASTDPPLTPSQAITSASESEQSLITLITAELQATRSLLPSVKAFLQHPTQKSDHLRLGELLLQSLLRLDAFSPEPAWLSARQVRKEAVKEIQSMLDSVDHAWAASGVEHIEHDTSA